MAKASRKNLRLGGVFAVRLFFAAAPRHRPTIDFEVSRRGVPWGSRKRTPTANKTTVGHSERREAQCRPKSKFCGLSEANKQNREAFAEAGYGLKSRWLFESMLHSKQKPPKLQAISLRRIGALVFPRYSLRKTSTTCSALRSE